MVRLPILPGGRTEEGSLLPVPRTEAEAAGLKVREKEPVRTAF